MTQYVGITIGPIFDTILDATSPARLWFASYCFSDLARRLCQGLVGSRLSDIQILSPYYDPADDGTDGVGKYHDHIIFSTSTPAEQLPDVLDEVVATAKADTLYDFYDDASGHVVQKAFLDRYLQVHYAICPEGAFEEGWNAGFTELSNLLDLEELIKTFPASDDHSPFGYVFSRPADRHDADQNRHVRESPLFRRVFRDSGRNGQLLKPNGRGIRDLADIAAAGSDWQKDPSKKRRYFAVVNADGDNMGKFFLTFVKDAQAQLKVSQALLYHDKNASSIIGAYGGMTIYAGGDDLLFLAPVEGADGRSIYRLCEDLAQEFHDSLASAFGESESLPTLSFGISIQFYKSPLYEALDRARKLLETAKNNSEKCGDKEYKKDRIVIGLQKHSGQTHRLAVPNSRFVAFEEVFRMPEEMSDVPASIRSVVRALRLFGPCFEALDSKAKSGEIAEEAYVSSWRNFFDNEGQSQMQDFVTRLASTYYQDFLTSDGPHILALPDEGSSPKKLSRDHNDPKSGARPMDALVELLLIRRFMDEDVSEDEREASEA